MDSFRAAPGTEIGHVVDLVRFVYYALLLLGGGDDICRMMICLRRFDLDFSWMGGRRRGGGYDLLVSLAKNALS